MIKYIFLLLLYSCAFSHPHTFIEVYPTIKKDKSKLINFKWKLDEMTSSILIMELDSNMDGKIDSKENKFIEREYFSMFKPYNYYTFIFVHGKKHPTKPKNFQASIEGNRLCYAFDVNLEASLKDIYFEFGDPDFYNAMVLKDEFIDADGLNANVTGVDKDFYYGFKLEFK